MIRRIMCITMAAFILSTSFAFAGAGFDAGYEWAAGNGIEDTDQCYSAQDCGYINNSPSFTEGCLQYLLDNVPAPGAPTLHMGGEAENEDGEPCEDEDGDGECDE